MSGSVKHAEIDAFHNFLMQRFGELTRMDSLQVLPENPNWKNTSRGGVKIVFLTQGPKAEFCMTNRGAHPTPCFPLNADDYSTSPRLWWAWREEWTPIARGTFELIGASLVFFWGASASPKAQVFRAEWDDARHRGDSRGQPHWHIDDKILAEGSWVPDVPLSPLEQGSDFDAIMANGHEQASDYSAIETAGTRTQLSVVNVSGMHLYMGGWDHDKEAPKCWQPMLNLEALKHWAARTLHYVQREADEVKEDF